MSGFKELFWKKAPSKLYLKKVYKKTFGKNLDLKDPKTFNEKIQWLKLYNKNPLYTKMVDKIEAKDIARKKIGSEYIIPTIGIYNKFDEIDFGKLPSSFVIKCSHDSGGIIICKDKSKLDINQAKNKIEDSLKKNFYYMSREWPYKNVKPRILIEEYLDELSDNIIDYKFMCFNGKVKYIFTCTERFSNEGLKVTWFDTKWIKQNFERHYPASTKKIKKPKNLGKMIKIAEKLSNGIPFIRIDLYNINGKILFGEYTFFPGAGLEEFTPEKWDKKLGSLITLPEK